MGLIGELSSRKVAFAAELNQRIQDGFADHLPRFGLTRENYLRSGGGWFLAFPGNEFDYLSYVQVETTSNDTRPNLRIYTGFRALKGLGSISMKREALEKLRDLPRANSSGVHNILVDRSIESVPGDYGERLVSNALRELEVQASAAEILRSIALGRRARRESDGVLPGES